MKRTKIVATLGPASDTRAKIEGMIQAGMNVARLNFSHGTHKHHALLIKNVRAAAKKFKEPVAILVDLQGPRLRLGKLPESGVNVKAGQEVTLDLDAKTCTAKVLTLNCPDLKDFRNVKTGHRLLITDGKYRGEVINVRKRALKIKITVGGLLTSNKGLNFPDSSLVVNSITSKDREDLAFVLKEGVDFVALSFVKNSAPVEGVKKIIRQQLKSKVGEGLPLVVVKIEKPAAFENFDEILKSADAIMVARGDLGLEAGEERVPIMQKEMIPKCLAAAKSVIVATQMLESMVKSPLPTRAEASDVANAVIDHTDAVMLSGETANGEYPVETVQEMSKIIIEAEKSRFDDLALAQVPHEEACLEKAAALLSINPYVKGIFVHSRSGKIGRKLSSLRREVPLFVSTESETTARQLNLSWGVRPVVLGRDKSLESWLKMLTAALKKAKALKKGDKVIILASDPWDKSDDPNLVEVRQL